MVTFAATTGDLADAEVDLLVVGATRPAGAEDSDDVLAPELDATGSALDDRLGYDVADACRAAGFDGAAGTSMRLPTRGAVPARLVMVVGLGAADEVTTETLRRAGAPIAEATARTASLATTLHQWGDLEAEAATRAVVEGITLGAYRFGTLQVQGRTAPARRRAAGRWRRRRRRGGHPPRADLRGRHRARPRPGQHPVGRQAAAGVRRPRPRAGRRPARSR